ncbi:hypothetical protein ACWKSP_16260 [Micromonosporaceae bacterium Da 78-11]
MRKLWYAGAVTAGGILLFGASPAQADRLPGAPRSGDLWSATAGAQQLRGNAVGQRTDQTLNANLLPESLLPGSGRRGLLGRGLIGRGLLGGGLGPNGSVPTGGARPTARQTEMFGGGLPLLGGLGGLLPVNSSPRTPDTSGLPAGGTPIAAPANASPVSASPKVDDPRGDDPVRESPAGDDTPGRPGRTPSPTVHARPSTTPSATGARLPKAPGTASAPRTFSGGGRPIAGVDPEYK